MGSQLTATRPRNGKSNAITSEIKNETDSATQITETNLVVRECIFEKSVVVITKNPQQTITNRTISGNPSSAMVTRFW